MINKRQIVLLTALVIGLSAVLFFINRRTSKTGYIQLQRVFDEFNGKGELEKKLKRSEEARRQVLDSLLVQIKTLDRKLTNQKTPDQRAVDQLQKLTQKYNTLNDKLTTEQQNQHEIYVKQIWIQINTYVNNFGEKFGYTYIYGAGGQGTLMYADQSKDITKEVIKYINEEYEGR